MADALTALVDTVKDAVVDPAAIVTLAGTVATAVFPLVSVTTAPPAGAAEFKVTVPFEVFPPMTGFGFRLTEVSPVVCVVVIVSVAV